MYGMLSGQQPPGLPLFQQGLLQLNSSSTHHHQQGSCLWTSAAAAAASKWETSAVSSQQQQQHQLQQQQQQDQVATSVPVEPTSVLDLRSPSSPNNSRALSSSCSSDAAPTALSHSSISHARLAAVSSASSSKQEQLVAQQLEEFSLQQHDGGGSSSGGGGDIGVGYEGSLHDQQQQQQQQPPASLSLFYSGMGIRQIIDTGGLEWPGVAAPDPWLASSQPDPSRRQLEDLESELMCPSPPPPAATSGDNSSLIRWLLGGGDGSGAEQSAWEQAPPPPPPLLQHHHGHPTMVKQELLDDDPFRQQQEWMMQQRQQQSSVPPQLAHLESFTRRTLPIPSPPPLLRPFSMAEAPIHRVPTTNWPPPPPPPAPQQQPQQTDPFISLMQQQPRQSQMGLMLGSAQQQQQLRELQASLSNKRALFEGSGSSSCQHQQQQPVKLARLTPPPAAVHAQLGHLQQTIASPGAQWSPGDDVGGARRSQQQQQQQQTPVAHRLLLRVAEACDCGREELAQSILARLNEHQQQQQQEQGQSEQQLSMAFLFRDALLERLRPSAATSATTEVSSPALQMFDRVAAFKALCEASPVLRFAYFTANQAIADATQGDDDVHIVDLSEVAAASRSRARRRCCSTFGSQWASFVVTAAATSRRRQRRIRVTLVSSAGDASIQFAVESLREFAAASPPSTEFEFRGVAVEPGGSLPGPVELGVRSGEAIAVNLVFPDAAAAPVLLAATRSLSPRLVTLVDRDLSPAGGLATRLREGLDYYTAMADSCVAAAGSGAASLADVERLVWRPEIDELLFGETTGTGLRPAAMAAAGFRPWRLSDACERQAECLLSPDKQQPQQRAENLIEFARDDGRLVLLGYRGKVLATASAWTSPP